MLITILRIAALLWRERGRVPAGPFAQVRLKRVKRGVGYVTLTFKMLDVWPPQAVAELASPAPAAA